MTQPTISSGYVKALLDYAVSQGLEREELLHRSGIRAADIAQPDLRTPIGRYVALMQAAIDRSGKPGLALDFGLAVRNEEVSIVGLIAAASATVREGREQMNRYIRLSYDDGGNGAAAGHLELVRDGEGVWLDMKGQIFIDHPNLTEASFAQCTHGVILTLGRNPFPNAIHFAYPEPPY
jgi:hypothetical protein